jgi:hypothetical protein
MAEAMIPNESLLLNSIKDELFERLDKLGSLIELIMHCDLEKLPAIVIYNNLWIASDLADQARQSFNELQAYFSD